MHKLRPVVLFFTTALLRFPSPLGSLVLQRKLIDKLNMFYQVAISIPWHAQL